MYALFSRDYSLNLCPPRSWKSRLMIRYVEPVLNLFNVSVFILCPAAQVGDLKATLAEQRGVDVGVLDLLSGGR